MEFKITSEQVDQRLDKFLVAQLGQLSRSQIQKQIQTGNVSVNNETVSKHYFLQENDIIQVKDQKQSVDFKLKPNAKIKLDIVFEDENYLVVNKPANLIVHASDSHPKNDTLINGVIAYYPEIVEVGEDEFRPGIVHRLDKEVSGLLVIAKTQEAFLDLKIQFKNREVYKEYAALVHGKLSKRHDIIKLNIERSRTKGYKMAAKADGNGKEAITEYDVLEEYNNYSLLKVLIHTGRTHQIRVHLNAIGYPVVGDKVYRPRSLKSSIDLNRIFLHARVLKFKNLQGESREYKQDLPTELNEFLLNL